MRRQLPTVLAILFGWLGTSYLLAPAAPADDAALKKAVTFYASFDEAVKADTGGGDLSPYTGIRPEPGKPKPAPTKGADPKVFTIAKKGIAGGCLEVLDVLPNNGRIFFAAKGNIAYKKGGWGGALSMWCNFDPDKMLKTKFCDPVQITHKGAHNGAIWFDYNDAKPRDMRHGAFSAIKEGEKGTGEDDPKAPMVRVPKVGWKAGDWHHVVISWKNFDTGKPDAVSQFWVDGKLIGEVKDRPISMAWDIDQVGIFTAISYIGLLDEFAIFNRPLAPDEIELLRKQPGVLRPLTRASVPPRIPDQLQDRLHILRKYYARHTLSYEEYRKEIQQAYSNTLKTKEGMAQAEYLLGDLWSLTIVGGKDPPPPPEFPYDAEAARRYQDAYAQWRHVPVEFTNKLGMKFRLIPPGTYLMGSPDNELGHNSTEYKDGPIHPVTITRPFYLSQFETTVSQFRKFVEATNYVTDMENKGGGNAHDAKAVWKHRPGTEWRKPGFAGPFELQDDHPVVHVSWTDARNFCAWLDRFPYVGPLNGKPHYDLPTEAQWEYACRAGAATRFWWGPDEDTTGKVINCGDRMLKKVQPEWPRSIMPMDDGHAFLAPVGRYRSNGFGLFDMLGNVWEFCSTHYGPYTKDAVTDPGHIDLKRGYAVRGGGWSNTANDCRCATRNADPPHFGHSNLCFRVALVLAEKK